LWPTGTSGDGNVLVSRRSHGLTVTGLIDPERALHGDPLIEIPSLSVFHDGLADEDFVVDEDFLDGYCEVAGPLVRSKSLRCRLRLYRIYLYLAVLIEVAPREMDGEDLDRRYRDIPPILERDLAYLGARLA
jgi:hypothetical protein